MTTPTPSNPPDHDVLIENTILTREMHRSLTEVLGQLSRGNERFQRMDSQLLQLETRMSLLERTLQTEVPRLVADARSDMVRSISTFSDQAKENVNTSIAPLKTQLKPITDIVEKSHKILVWGVRTLIAIGVAAGTALAVAYALKLFSI